MPIETSKGMKSGDEAGDQQNKQQGMQIRQQIRSESGIKIEIHVGLNTQKISAPWHINIAYT